MQCGDRDNISTMSGLGLGRLRRSMTIPEVLDGVLEMQDVQHDEEPRTTTPKSDLDLRGASRSLKIKKETTHVIVR